MIKLERVYDKRSSADGKHYLVERLCLVELKRLLYPSMAGSKMPRQAQS
jgi:hypothetical protein